MEDVVVRNNPVHDAYSVPVGRNTDDYQDEFNGLIHRKK